MVISQVMSENEVGYRGTKSVIPPMAVKAQRVDGSWWTKVHLRCTLIAPERGYQARILATGIITRSYSSQATTINP